MTAKIEFPKLGLALVLLGLIFGIAMGVAFGLNEDLFKDYVAQGVAANPGLHDEKSISKIWRYAQRAHFHATGIAAFSIGLILLITLADMKSGMKKIAAVLVGLGSLYPLAWLNMYYLAPSLGRTAAHHHVLTELLTKIGVIGLLTGIFLLSANLFLGLFRASR